MDSTVYDSAGFIEGQASTAPFYFVTHQAGCPHSNAPEIAQGDQIKVPDYVLASQDEPAAGDCAGETDREQGDRNPP